LPSTRNEMVEKLSLSGLWGREQETIPCPHSSCPCPAKLVLVAILHQSIKCTDLLFSYRYSVLDIGRSIDDLIYFNDKLMDVLRFLLLIY
jgi:hypothetical protein